MVEQGHVDSPTQGTAMWRPRPDAASDRTVPPWAEPDAQAPPPPTQVYQTLSPTSSRRQMKLAAPTSSAVEASPSPKHFNRPTPGASPVPTRRSLLRNNGPHRARSVDSLSRAPPWADHKLRNTRRTDAPITAASRVKATSSTSLEKSEEFIVTASSEFQVSTHDQSSGSVIVGLQQTPSTVPSTKPSTESQSEEQSSPTPWRKNVPRKATDADVTSASRPPPSGSPPNLNPVPVSVHIDTAASATSAPQQAPWRKTAVEGTEQSKNMPVECFGAGQESSSQVESGQLFQPSWRKQRTRPSDTTTPATQPSTSTSVSSQHVQSAAASAPLSQERAPEPPQRSDTSVTSIKNKGILPSSPPSSSTFTSSSAPAAPGQTSQIKPKKTDPFISPSPEPILSKESSGASQVHGANSGPHTSSVPITTPPQSIGDLQKTSRVTPSQQTVVDDMNTKTTQDQTDVLTDTTNEAKYPSPPPPLLGTSTIIPLPTGSSDTFPLPPPPSFVQEGRALGPPPPQLMQLLEGDSGVGDQEYVRESVTKRIKAFEKQASMEEDQSLPERLMPPARPVAPWVKKTSAGPVVHDTYWDMTSPEESSGAPAAPTTMLMPTPGPTQVTPPAPPPPPAAHVHFTPPPSPPSSAHTSGQINPLPVSTSSAQIQSQVTLPPPPPSVHTPTQVERTSQSSRPPQSKANIPSAPPPAPSPRITPGPQKSQKVPQHPGGSRSPGCHRARAVPQRKRSISTGDFFADYIISDADLLKMPAEGSSALAPEAPVPSSPMKDDPLYDPWCDPKNPRTVTFQDVSAAAFKIKSGIMNTQCTRSHLSSMTGMEIFFKKEFNQLTGSFKERGARYTLLMLSEDQRSKGVIAASAGNHALALSYHGQDLGIPVTVVMPIVAPIMKVQACRQHGANVIVKGKDIGECREYALRMAKEQGLLYINGYDHPHIIAGQGTMGLEIVEQVPNIDAIVIPVGGGGLIAGVAVAMKALYPHIKVIGVESERCASFSNALKAGKPVYVKAESTLSDGLAVPMIGVNAFATGAPLIDKVVVVKEEWIAISILRLVEGEKAVVEGAGATGLAAILAGELPELKGKRVVLPLCGGNIDTTVLGRCLERGLAADGRLVKFTVTVSDRPGGIAELTRLLANLGVSIKDMVHERAWIRSDIFSVEVKVMAETRDYDHFLEMKSALEQRYDRRFRFAMPDCVHDESSHLI